MTEEKNHQKERKEDRVKPFLFRDNSFKKQGY